MKTNVKQVSVNKIKRKEYHIMLDQLLEACYIDAMTGKFHCKICNNVVHVDLSKRIVFCPIHGILI